MKTHSLIESASSIALASSGVMLLWGIAVGPAQAGVCRLETKGGATFRID